jgi:hypothetical protein
MKSGKQESRNSGKGFQAAALVPAFPAFLLSRFKTDFH